MNEKPTRNQKLRNEFGELYQAVTEVLLKYDPVGIVFEDNLDEYDPELFTILPELKHCKSETEVLELVHKEFVRWFSESTAGAREHYEPIAKEIWEIWSRQAHE
ncbi:MAG: hypothetical protein WBF13_05650 [Candidatus Zixiibacteriota bacterium]